MSGHKHRYPMVFSQTRRKQANWMLGSCRRGRSGRRTGHRCGTRPPRRRSTSCTPCRPSRTALPHRRLAPAAAPAPPPPRP
ncbi:Os11g0265650 [Oryza sativa Japonica Group]|uniref:Os11g0265650 protein n=1 Tax=Oryza sativa subsp. japonica TaxID=39947 RepID=A0A0P0Y134_ORYSJ|nr:hypothetical protein EE612_054639 [Oryza sativa]BAT13532.1 Os11g0265650 [Oryza sativa Japonica Group]